MHGAWTPRNEGGGKEGEEEYMSGAQLRVCARGMPPLKGTAGGTGLSASTRQRAEERSIRATIVR